METINLNGTWKATAGAWADEFSREDFDDAGWAEIPVPSHWQEHEPFRDYPEEVVFRKKFEYRGGGDGRAFLRFKGVFYFARAWLNGSCLGEHTGCFFPFRFDATDALREGENVLAVYVRCERERDINDKKQVMGVFAHWDCKPHHVQPGGIWNDVEIVREPPRRVESLRIGNFALGDGEARAGVEVTLGGLGAEARGYVVEWKISPAGFEGETAAGKASLADMSEARRAASFEAVIPRPRLWWTWDHGGPALYVLEAVLRGEDGADRGALDTKSVRFGVRTVEMRDWHLHLNGRRIFCRGSNYAPSDVRIASATRERYNGDVRLMLEAGFNMIRVHAHVEKEEFYDACDEAGILVWQDFPLQWFYSEEIAESAAEQIKKMARMLGNHPSVAVWCCHNEPFRLAPPLPVRDIVRERRVGEYLSSVAGIFGPNWNKNVLDRRLREAVLETDVSRPVVLHSGIPWLFGEGTDAHFYFGWYVGTMRMTEAVVRMFPRDFHFITEYGAQAFPSIGNFRKMQNVDRLDELDWDSLEKNNMLQRRLMDRFAPPAADSLEEYIGRTQWYQARVVKYKTELFRRLKYRPCGGAVHFMFTDCCPAVTWAVVDYWRAPKQGYHALKEALRPLHVFADFPRRRYRRGTFVSLRVYVVNDFHRKFPGSTVRWWITDREKRAAARGETRLDVAEDSLQRAGRVTWETDGAAPGGYALLLELDTGAETISNQYEFEIRK
ncbi:MAG: glycoside hydrolase family 2 TIM barrel-domain containing protein [bacterium]